MSGRDVWATVPTRRIDVADTHLAYRRLGPAEGVPIVLLNHWAANLDNFDPAIVDALAVDRPVYAFDYRGIGESGGVAPRTIKDTSVDIVAAIRALVPGPVDVIGFSFGGFVAQQILFDAPDLFRRVILAGTGPAGGTGIERVGTVSWPLIAKGLVTFRDPKTFLFFTPTANGRHAAQKFIMRLQLRKTNPDKPVGMSALLRQLAAIKAWGQQPAQPLESIRIPVLVANGDNDIMVPTPNPTTWRVAFQARNL